MNHQLAANIKSAIERVAAHHGDFDLAALVQRDGTPSDMWDLVLVAPWLTRNKRETLQLLFAELRRSLTRADFLRIARIVLLGQVDRTIDAVPHFQPAGDDVARSTGPGTFLGIDARDAYLLMDNGALQRP